MERVLGMPAISPLMQADPNAGRVGRSPQTTTPEVSGGPFLRQSREGRVQGYTSSANALGGLVNLPLKAVPGYLRYLDLYISAGAGVNGSVTVAAQADAPYSGIQNVLLRDAFGFPIIQGSGYSVLKAIAMYGGQHGFWNGADPANLPSFSAVSTGGSGTGNFTFRSRLPLELFDGFCSIAAANAAAVPQLTLTLGSSAQLYSTAPGTLPTLTVGVQQAFYAIPLGDPSIAPPDNGSSHQWNEQNVAASLSSATSASLVLPQMGSFVTSLGFIFRDSTGARIDTALPAATGSIELWVDDAPMFIEDLGTRTDLMFQYYGLTRPTGVLWYPFRQSVGNFGPVSSIDTGDLFLYTTPGTQLELRSSAWGTFSNAPATVTVLSGRVYAEGGIPYTHLSD